MNTLWEIIKNLGDGKEISAQDLTLAEATLDPNVFLILKAQLEGKLKMSNDQWV